MVEEDNRAENWLVDSMWIVLDMVQGCRNPARGLVDRVEGRARQGYGGVVGKVEGAGQRRKLSVFTVTRSIQTDQVSSLNALVLQGKD